jgi:hypothetical protein
MTKQYQQSGSNGDVTAELKHTARHEACHAVAALVFGKSVTEVTIVPSQGRFGSSLGGCRTDPVFRPSGSGVFLPGDRERCEQEVMIYLAGPVGCRERSRIPKGRPRRLGGDWANACFLADALARNLHSPSGHEQTKLYLQWLSRRAKALIDFEPHHHAVCSVARALIVSKTLGHAETFALYLAGLATWTREAEESFNESVKSFVRPVRLPDGLSREHLLEIRTLAEEVHDIQCKALSRGGFESVCEELRRAKRIERALHRRLDEIVRYKQLDPAARQDRASGPGVHATVVRSMQRMRRLSRFAR